MAQVVSVDVSVKDVVWDSVDNVYRGQFKYQQKSPSNPKIIGKTGNIDASAVNDSLDLTFNLKTKKVKIGGTDYDVSLKNPVNQSVLLGNGILDKPTNPAPPSGGPITVNPGGTDSFVMSDSNDNGGKYSYALELHVDKDGGQKLMDDPIIINRQPSA
ncbi:hypothetical protein [Sphingomicrobium lutaoense]|uniref:Uncharacterized protein n=1 Tax=Sphingomicrobium lutaoense TaxID=515949 RepID=A0A839Z1F3_9SPHN|nr:hypothetical protein [Sphingomicrobium lutaoense]MBB3764388.1 hypothetical protein [Sphingomicrobium lutaoense]